MRATRCAVVVLIAAALPALGCGNSTSPSPQFPNVAGNYSGTVTISFPLLNVSVTCPATASVTQSGATVNVPTVTFGGTCAMTIPTLPLGSFTIDSTGALTTPSVTNLPVSACNGAYNATLSGGFSGRTFQVSMVFTAVSGGCVNELGNFSISFNMSD